MKDQEKEMVSVPIQTLEKLLDYLYISEQTHWMEGSDEDKDHAFLKIKELKEICDRERNE